MFRRALAVGLALLILLARGSPGWAIPHPQARSVITFPQSNMAVSGVIEIRGVAYHSSAQWWYNVSYAPGAQATGGSQWVTLAQVDNTPIQDGVLATWDTTRVPDGVYTLALTVKGQDDPQYWQHTIENLTVSNALAAPSPTPEQPTPAPMPTAVVGETPTPVIVIQPPTSTPMPSPTPGEGTPTASPADEGLQSRLVFDSQGLRGAFCNGGLITLMLFLLWGLYMLAKASIRWYMRGRARARQE